MTARSDLTWDTFDLFVWTATETFLLIFCGSASTLKPLLDLIRGKNPMGSSRYGSRNHQANRYHHAGASVSQKQATSKKLSTINRESVSNQARVTSDATTEEWPLNIKDYEGIQHTIEFDVIHEQSPSRAESGRSADGGFGENGFHIV